MVKIYSTGTGEAGTNPSETLVGIWSFRKKMS